MLKTAAFLLLFAMAVVAPASADETAEQHNARPGTLQDVPPPAKDLAVRAKAAFEKEDYAEAEALYAQAVEIAPNNLHVVCNLGVAQFRQQKYAAAEKSFRQAISIAPEDDFSWCTLGVVQYSQNQFPAAIKSLEKSIALNPKSSTAHNYLGISVAQKGQLEKARKELETAIQLDPKYSDAYFNLAVVFTLHKPAKLEEARQAYKKAVDLGAEPDAAMEKTLDGHAPADNEPEGADAKVIE